MEAAEVVREDETCAVEILELEVIEVDAWVEVNATVLEALELDAEEATVWVEVGATFVGAAEVATLPGSHPLPSASTKPLAQQAPMIA